MSVKWQHNHWFWFAAICAVGGTAALWRPLQVPVERHGEAIKVGRPHSVNRTPTSSPSGLDQESATTTESTSLKHVLQLPTATASSASSPSSRDVENDATHFAPLSEHPAAVLTLPDRTDSAVAQPTIAGVSHLARQPQLSPTLNHEPTAATQDEAQPSAVYARPQIIAGPGTRPAANQQLGYGPVRLSGRIAPLDE